MTNLEDRLESLRVKYLNNIKKLEKDIEINNNLPGPERWTNLHLAEQVKDMQQDMLLIIWILQRIQNPFS